MRIEMRATVRRMQTANEAVHPRRAIVTFDVDPGLPDKAYSHKCLFVYVDDTSGINIGDEFLLTLSRRDGAP